MSLNNMNEFLDYSEYDLLEKQKIENFLNNFCDCSKCAGHKNDIIFLKDLIEHRLCIQDMDEKSKDLIIVTYLSCALNMNNKCNFIFKNKKICKNVFIFVQHW